MPLTIRTPSDSNAGDVRRQTATTEVPRERSCWVPLDLRRGDVVDDVETGVSRLFADIDREIAPDRPDVDRLIAIGVCNGLTLVD